MTDAQDKPVNQPASAAGALAGAVTPKDKATLDEKATLETITAIHRWTDTLLTFRTTRPSDYPFVPGQYSRLGLSDGNSVVWRAYSITSIPSDRELEYYSIVVPGGAFTTLLNQAQPGDRIWIDRQQFGFMTASRFVDGDTLWMLATGTGIGPYVSILRDPAVWRQFRHLVLVHGVRQSSELSYRDVLLTLQAQPPVSDADGAPLATLHLASAVSREPAGGSAGALHGRITTLLENGSLEAAVGLPMSAESSRVMLCGNPDMIEDARRILHERGMRPCRRAVPGQFVTENYW